MFYCYELNPNDDQHMDFTNLLKKLLGLLGVKKKLIDLVRKDKKSDRIEELREKCERKTRISSAIYYSTLLPESVFQSPITTFRNIIYSNAADSWPVDKKIN